MQFVTSHAMRRAWPTLLLCLPLWLGAAPLEIGSAWPTLTLKDQHEQTVVIDEGTRQVLFTAEKVVSDRVSLVLGAQGRDMLAQTKTVYVADISAMPAVISRMFALPQLRKLPFSIALAREAGVVTDLPRRKGFATLMTQESGRIAKLQYLETETQLRQALAP